MPRARARVLARIWSVVSRIRRVQRAALRSGQPLAEQTHVAALHPDVAVGEQPLHRGVGVTGHRDRDGGAPSAATGAFVGVGESAAYAAEGAVIAHVAQTTPRVLRRI